MNDGSGDLIDLFCHDPLDPWGGIMGWLIHCTDKRCDRETWAGNIVELVDDHTDGSGWLKCSCGKPGYIEKNFALQEPGETWEPYLRGIIPLGQAEDTYQPFVFLVSYKPTGPVSDVWFSYYKDLRSSGGRLKLGYGPGGPPVLGVDQVIKLLKHLVRIGAVSGEKVARVLKGAS